MILVVAIIKPSSQNIFSELFVPIVEINSPYGYNIKKLPIPQKSVSSFSNGIGGTL